METKFSAIQEYILARPKPACLCTEKQSAFSANFLRVQQREKPQNERRQMTQNFPEPEFVVEVDRYTLNYVFWTEQSRKSRTFSDFFQKFCLSIPTNI